MFESSIPGIIVGVIVAIASGVITIYVQTSLTKSKEERDIRHKRITKLLLPLYVRLMNESAMVSIEHVNENGDPADFYHQLPTYYQPTVKVLEENLYLADTELTWKSLRFINWVKVSAFDSSRLTRVIEGKLDDEPLEEFRKCVYKKYEHEKKLYNKYSKVK